MNLHLPIICLTEVFLFNFYWPRIWYCCLENVSCLDLFTNYVSIQDQKKLQGQLIAEQEALYGSKPSPSKTQSVKKAPRMSTGGASSRRLSVGGAMHQTPKPDTKRPIRKSDRVQPNDHMNPQDDAFSVLSAGRFLYFNLWGIDAHFTPYKNSVVMLFSCLFWMNEV